MTVQIEKDDPKMIVYIEEDGQGMIMLSKEKLRMNVMGSMKMNR
jgi:hypothetical protein